MRTHSNPPDLEREGGRGNKVVGRKGERDKRVTDRHRHTNAIANTHLSASAVCVRASVQRHVQVDKQTAR